MPYIYRIKYSKDGPLKYVSHLDLNTLFCRTLRRAQIPVELTQGFNPRFKVSFGPALPLGIASREEVLDINLTREMNSEQIKDRINGLVPKGLKIQQVKGISEKDANLSNVLRYAIYLVGLNLRGYEQCTISENAKECLKRNIDNFLKQENIMVEKNTKKGLREVNLRPYIKNLEIVSVQDDIFTIKLTVDIQYRGSINPILIINEFIKRLDKKDICIIDNITRRGFDTNK